MTIRPTARPWFGLALVCAGAALAGCQNLPTSGPTAHEIVKHTQARNTDFNFRIVNLDDSATVALNQASAREAGSTPRLSSLAAEGRVDLIGPGDMLVINIYEVGVSLFSGGVAHAAPGAAFDPSAHSETLPPVVVDNSGQIDVPYLGRLTVAGLTTADVQAMVSSGLARQSQSPQALVTVKENIANTVFVSGDVHKPGRIDLTLGREHLLDAIAIAGGGASPAEDTIVRFARGGRIVEQRLSSVQSSAPDDLILEPGDRIELIKNARTYVVFGATYRVSRVPFGPGGDSLAEALAQVGGPNDGAADASAVFLFRDGAQMAVPVIAPPARHRKGAPPPPAPATALTPIVLRLNMMNPNSYIIAQRFAMRDKDVLYIANARTNQLMKAAAIVGQLFTPFVAARQVAPN